MWNAGTSSLARDGTQIPCMGVQGSPQHTFEKVPFYPEHRSLLHAYFFSAEAIIRILNGRLQFPMPGVDKKPEKSRCLELWSGPQMVKTL